MIEPRPAMYKASTYLQYYLSCPWGLICLKHLAGSDLALAVVAVNWTCCRLSKGAQRGRPSDLDEIG